MTVQVVTFDNLHQDQFTKVDNKIELLHTVNTYEIALRGTARYGETGGWTKRAYLQVSGAVGYVHLDIRSSTRSTQVVGRLPDSAPTPTKLIEVQAFDGSTFWINEGARQVNATINTQDARYIVNIMGFFS